MKPPLVAAVTWEPGPAEAAGMQIGSANGWTVRSRLVLLVLLPLAVVVGAVGLVAHDRRSESRAAAEVEAQVEGLRTLVGLQAALYGERAAVELQFRSAAFGVPPRGRWSLARGR